jgi:NADH-quinone oxidoreductase subunit J
MSWIQQNWALLLPLVLGACGVWLLMPGKRAIRPLGGLAALGALALGFQLVAGDRDVSGVMYLIISTFCLIAAVLMITSRNPVYGALWFALVTLCVCGLFLLQSAPFLAAASIIVYAGAIIVTFLFVMMLAQQSGANAYDQSSRQPFVASVIAFTLLGMFLITFQSWGEQQMRLKAAKTVPAGAIATATPSTPSTTLAHVSSRPAGTEQIGELRGLGRALFSDFLFSVEIAGTLLLIASIGAIALAPRRAQGTL